MVTNFPLRGQRRTDALLDTVRGLDTASMTTPEVVEAIEAAAPDATVDEIIAALRQVGAEHMQEAATHEATR